MEPTLMGRASDFVVDDNLGECASLVKECGACITSPPLQLRVAVAANASCGAGSVLQAHQWQLLWLRCCAGFAKDRTISRLTEMQSVEYLLQVRHSSVSQLLHPWLCTWHCTMHPITWHLMHRAWRECCADHELPVSEPSSCQGASCPHDLLSFACSMQNCTALNWSWRWRRSTPSAAAQPQGCSGHRRGGAGRHQRCKQAA
jgi:hypothetical protein